MKALAIALALMALPALASAQESAAPEPRADAPPEATTASDEAAPVLAAIPPVELAPVEGLALPLTAAEWPSSPLAPTNALNPRVERSMDLGFVVTGAALGGLSYLAKGLSLGLLEAHGCRDASMALTLIPYLGGPIGMLHGLACRATAPDTSYERTLFGQSGGGWLILTYGVGAAMDVLGIAFLIAGLVGGEGVVTDPPPEGGLALNVGPGGMSLDATF